MEIIKTMRRTIEKCLMMGLKLCDNILISLWRQWQPVTWNEFPTRNLLTSLSGAVPLSADTGRLNRIRIVDSPESAISGSGIRFLRKFSISAESKERKEHRGKCWSWWYARAVGNKKSFRRVRLCTMVVSLQWDINGDMAWLQPCDPM